MGLELRVGRSSRQNSRQDKTLRGHCIGLKGLPDLANKNVGNSVKLEFQINNEKNLV